MPLTLFGGIRFQFLPGGIFGCFVSSDVTIQHMLLVCCNPAKKVEGNQSKRNGLFLHDV